MSLNGCETLNTTDKELQLFQTVAYTPVFVAGLLLNTSVLWLFFRLRCWTDTHIYTLNLLVTDLLLVLFLPVRIYDTVKPLELTRFCSFLISVHYVNMYVSMFTIAAISAHRFVAVNFPLLTKAWESRRKTIAYVACFLVWTTVIIICTSFQASIKPDKLLTCYERRILETSLSNLLVLEIVGYLLPMAAVVTCSTGAMCTVQKAVEDNLHHPEEKSTEERRKTVAIIKANMIVFIVCFTPLHVGYLLKYLFPCNKEKAYFISVFFKVTQWIAATNCCLDSVGYYFLLKNVFRGKDPKSLVLS